MILTSIGTESSMVKLSQLPCFLPETVEIWGHPLAGANVLPYGGLQDSILAVDFKNAEKRRDCF